MVAHCRPVALVAVSDTHCCSRAARLVELRWLFRLSTARRLRARPRRRALRAVRQRAQQHAPSRAAPLSRLRRRTHGTRAMTPSCGSRATWAGRCRRPSARPPLTASRFSAAWCAPPLRSSATTRRARRSTPTSYVAAASARRHARRGRGRWVGDTPVGAAPSPTPPAASAERAVRQPARPTGRSRTDRGAPLPPTAPHFASQWLPFITWHTGLFVTLTLGVIGVQGKRQNYW